MKKANVYLDFVGFNKLSIGIDIVDILVSQSHPVAPVQWADVIIDRRLHGLPVVFDCVETEQWNDKRPLTTVASDLPEQARVTSPFRGLLCQRLGPSPVSSNSQPNLRASWIAVLSKAVWCISFLGIQPTFTHVPPRPDHSKEMFTIQLKSSHISSRYCQAEVSYPRRFLWGLAQRSPAPWPSSPIQQLPMVNKGNWVFMYTFKCLQYSMFETVSSACMTGYWSQDYNISLFCTDFLQTTKLHNQHNKASMLLMLHSVPLPLSRQDLQILLQWQWGHSHTFHSLHLITAAGCHLCEPKKKTPHV